MKGQVQRQLTASQKTYLEATKVP